MGNDHFGGPSWRVIEAVSIDSQIVDPRIGSVAQVKGLRWLVQLDFTIHVVVPVILIDWNLCPIDFFEITWFFHCICKCVSGVFGFTLLMVVEVASRREPGNFV